MSTLSTINVKHPTSALNNITLDNAGNVGVGTATPASFGKLVALGADNATLVAAVGATNMLRVQGYNSTYVGTVIESVNLAQTVNTPLFVNGSQIAFGVSGTERGRFDTSGNFQFNSGYGSVATAFGCRAWVNFNGTGVVAIRASGNVTSITDNAVGDYTVNFTTSLTDANYALLGTSGQSAAVNNMNCVGRNLDNSLQTASAVRIFNLVTNTSAAIDNPNIFVSVFR